MFWCGCIKCDSTFSLKDNIRVYTQIVGGYQEPVATVTCPHCGAEQDFEEGE